MYPTIYLIILLTAQETPMVLANQISIHACWGRLLGTAEGWNAFIQLPFVGFCWQERPMGLS